eukprot:GAHX01000873.1.p1 GENE.GAHX01000873.1~~GAHX01000873.1.p1  ORF type:complete len:430 (-),score=88.38 GAHX01000873.1:38-1327(-)
MDQAQKSPNDNLNLTEHVRSSEGVVLFSGNITKINPMLKFDHRIIVVTERHISNLGDASTIIKKITKGGAKTDYIRGLFRTPKRKIRIENVLAVSITSQNTELVLHINDDYGYHFDCGNERELLLGSISIAYKLATKNDLVVLHSEMTKLHKIVLTNTRIKKYSALANDRFFHLGIDQSRQNADVHSEEMTNNQLETTRKILAVEKNITGVEETLIAYYPIIKINKRLKQQKRMLFVTKNNIYTGKEGSSDYRKVIISEIKSVIFSLFTSEVVISYPADYDLYIVAKDKKYLIETIALLNNNISFCFTSKVNLKKMVMTKDNTDGYGYDYETHFWSFKEYMENMAEISYENDPQDDSFDNVQEELNEEPGKYSYDELMAGDELPNGVDSRFIELSLKSVDFLERFGMTQTEFAILPKTERSIIKRKAGF